MLFLLKKTFNKAIENKTFESRKKLGYKKFHVK